MDETDEVFSEMAQLQGKIEANQIAGQNLSGQTIAYDNAKFERERNKEKRQQIKIACLEAALHNTGCGVPHATVVEAAKAFYNFVRT